jgi:hypothetical protein
MKTPIHKELEKRCCQANRNDSTGVVEELLLLVTVLSEALFTLVRRNLMTLSFFTARHNFLF